ncbi:MAG: hypothetical protein FWE84_02885 [Firmicutes bacterium]|nr:hypothetical protein [Bacillota bacterium]
MGEKLKYIHVRHWDYWYGVYEIGDYKQEDISGLEFNLTNDEEGEKIFFHFDLLNIPALEHMIAEDEYIGKDDIDCELFLQQYENLKNQKIDFFIADLFYLKEKRIEIGYGYLSLRDCQLNGKSVFELKNKNNEKPYYGTIFVSDPNALMPQRVIHWMEKLSDELFKEKFRVQFAKVPNKDETVKAHEEDWSIGH